jgi:hypothetical protein
MIEKTVDTKTACRKLGIGHTLMTKLKHEMGIAHSKRFFLSDVAKHISARRKRLRRDHLEQAVDRNGERLSRRGLKTSSL